MKALNLLSLVFKTNLCALLSLCFSQRERSARLSFRGRRKHNPFFPEGTERKQETEKPPVSSLLALQTKRVAFLFRHRRKRRVLKTKGAKG